MIILIYFIFVFFCGFWYIVVYISLFWLFLILDVEERRKDKLVWVKFLGSYKRYNEFENSVIKSVWWKRLSMEGVKIMLWEEYVVEFWEWDVERDYR